MYLRVLISALLVGWGFPLILRAQAPRVALDPWLDFVESEEDRQLIGERLLRLSQNPLDLNSASAEELSLIPCFDDFFIRNFLLYRSRMGRLESVYELKNIPGAPILYLPLTEPYLTILPPERAQHISQMRQEFYSGADILLRDTSRTTPGIGFRYSLEKGREWSAYLVGEKDRGEAWLPLRQGVMDHLSFSVMHRGKGAASTIRQVILGDFRMTSGEGLLYGMGISYFSKVESGTKTSYYNRGTPKPHRSFREFGYVRGGALTLGHHDLSLTLLGGYLPLDARLEEGRISTLYRTGMHRTPREIMYRHTAAALTGGGYLAYDLPEMHLGLSYLSMKFRSKEREALIPPAPFPSTNIYNAASIDLFYLRGPWMVHGEGTLPLSGRDSWGGIMGIGFKDDLWGDFSLGARYLGNAFASPLGMPDAHFSNGRNEKGFYLQWRGEVARYLEGRVYYDRYAGIVEDPRRASQRGQVLLCALTHQGYGNIWTLRYRLRSSKESAHHNLRGQWTGKISSGRLKCGGTLNFAPATHPSYTLQVLGSLKRKAMHLEGGLQYFNATRGSKPLGSLRTYLPYHYYTPLLRGAGMRYSAILGFRPTTALDLKARFSYTHYSTLPTTPLPTMLEVTLLYRL